MTSNVPKSMVEALEWDDPEQALRALAGASQRRADQFALELANNVLGDQKSNNSTLSVDTSLPDILILPSGSTQDKKKDHPIYTAVASAESIYHTLSKIASGGSQASQEIRQLEQDKHDLDAHAAVVQTAISLRKASDQAQQALQTQQYHVVADAVRPWLDLYHAKDPSTSPDPRIRQYVGEYSLQQLSNIHQQLKTVLLRLYQEAVHKSDLKTLGQLTPVLSTIYLEKEAVELYLQFLKDLMKTSLAQAVSKKDPSSKIKEPPFAPMARVYNAGVACLRHHLPMVSHCLHRANGDVAVVQLVHVQVEEQIVPLLESYRRQKQLPTVSRQAQRIYAALEERYTGKALVDDNSNIEDENSSDCGFSHHIGSLADVDSAMEETVLCIQNAESYLRFIAHTCGEVNRARKLRFDKERNEEKLKRERKEWESGRTPKDEDNEVVYKPIDILAANGTPLHVAVAELGGEYASIERCLLLASMQRTFMGSDTDSKYYRPLSITKSGGKALQTVVVDTCLYTARRGAQRAFASGHTGTASAMTNFVIDCLSGVVLEVLSHRAEESGVAMLKPGEGLISGSGSLFNASNLIRQGTNVGHAVTGHHKDEIMRHQKIQKDIAHACAMINDVEVAVKYIEQLEAVLNESIEKGFPPGTHDTEQLVMCVKGMGPTRDSFRVAADGIVESLESVLRSRIRSIVGDSIGGEGSSGFMSSSVIGGGKSGDTVSVRMNYNLNEEAYNLLQLGEGYIARLCTTLDELLAPLRTFLAPRLWDSLLLHAVGTASKRLEASLRKCEYTALGALALDSDMRDLLNFTKDHLNGTQYGSNLVVIRACSPLSRLLQIAKLVSVDDLDDVVDLISASKRKNNWDLKLDEAKFFLCQRVEFDNSKVHELLRIPDDN